MRPLHTLLQNQTLRPYPLPLPLPLRSSTGTMCCAGVDTGITLPIQFFLSQLHISLVRVPLNSVEVFGGICMALETESSRILRNILVTDGTVYRGGLGYTVQ